MRRNGIYFSLDALLAITLLGSALSMVLVSGGDPVGAVTGSYRQADTAAEDGLQLLARADLGASLAAERQEQLLNSTVLTEEDLNSSALEAVAVLWASNQTAAARDLVRRFIGRGIDDRFEYRVRVINENSSLIYRSAPLGDEAAFMARSARIVSGVARNRPTTGYIAKASLSSVGAVRSDYYYFGGYVGNGNLTANMTLPEHQQIRAVTMELAAAGDFNLTINGQSAGQYNASGGAFTGQRFTVCNRTYHTIRCGALEAGDNRFGFRFTGNGSAISGGFIRVRYNETESLDVQSGRYETDVQPFPGIQGLVNYFGSMYAPGTLQGLSAVLHYDTNNTIFLRIGNVSVYSNTTEGETRVTIDNSTMVSRLRDANITLKALSNRTVPVRLGIRNISQISGQEVDAVSVIDVSGSMGTGTRLEEAKNASKRFTEIITNVSGNRAGMVAYESSVRRYHRLTTNGQAVKDEIEELYADGGTCIGCGILNATETVLEPGYVRKVRRGTTWRWNASYPASAPPDQGTTNWTEAGYDDGSWSSGIAVLGRGTSVVSTVLPDNTGDYHVRRTFEVDTSEYTDARLYIRSDDAASVYLNGQLIDNDTTEHAGRYWNRVTGEVALGRTLWEYTDGFEEVGLSSNWSVTSGTQGSEVVVSNACGTVDGQNATVLRWGGATLRATFPTDSGEYLEELRFSFRQGRDDGPNGNCENPEAGEDVMVEYQRADGSWTTLKTFRGGGDEPPEGSWERYTVSVPRDILHTDGRFRFRYPTASGSDSDYWALDAVTAVTAAGEQVEAINMTDLRDGRNVIAARLKDDGEQHPVGWLTETTSDWSNGSFVNTTASEGRLELESTAGATREDVDAGSYCSVSGGDTSYGEYITGVSINGIDKSSGNNGGYLDATDSISDQLVPGNSYRIEVTFHTGGYQEYAAVAFDWDGDGSMTDQSATRIGSCSTNGCTVSTQVTVPSDAATGSTLMRVMGEYSEYHTQPCQDPQYNEIEDYSAYVDESRYVGNGSYRSRLLDVGTNVSWSSADINATTPPDTAVSVDYSDGSAWYDTLSAVPNSSTLRYNVSLSTTNDSVTPSVDHINLTYSAQTVEFDAALELTQVRNRSMVVMSDGQASAATSMTAVPDHDGDGDTTDDPEDHTIEAACRAWQDHGIRVYTVGFGSDVDNATLNSTAQCGNGEYYYADTGELTSIFRKISESILEAARTAQRLTVTGGDGGVNGSLYADSYLRLNYSSPRGLEFGKVALTQTSDRFGGGVTSPNNGSFYVPAQTEVLDARLLSYSSRYWIDYVRMRGEGGWRTVYNISRYGMAYPELGDPFQVHLPPDAAAVGAWNNVSVDTAPNRTAQTGGSPDSRVVYDLLVDGFVGYGDVFLESEGGTVTVNSEYEDFNLSVGNSSAAWNPQQDAIDNATARLLDQLDVDDDDRVEFQVKESQLTIDEGSVSGIRWLWGPARIVLEVWKP